MSAKILDGRQVAEKMQAETEQEVAAFTKENGIAPTLALVRAGDDPASVSYARMIKRTAEKRGIVFKSHTRPAGVDEAEMVVTCGRGIKDPQNISIVTELATELNAALGGSRPIVDQGWMKHHQQVGQSGRTIAPKLYIACGISGAIQHLVGMRTSDTIVAINTDPDAPIFQVSDFGIVGSLFDIVPALVKELRRVKAQK